MRWLAAFALLLCLHVPARADAYRAWEEQHLLASTDDHEVRSDDREFRSWQRAYFLSCCADAVTTTGMLRRGGHELNPAIRGFVHNDALYWTSEALNGLLFPQFVRRTLGTGPRGVSVLRSATIFTFGMSAWNTTVVGPRVGVTLRLH